MIGNTMTLIIEDNPGDALLLKEQLNQAGWPANDSYHHVKLLDAIKRLEDIRPAVVFLDLNLPDSNGIETFLSVHSVAPEVPIIILSGMNDTQLSLQAVKAGAQDFLVKGEFEEKTLLKTILYGIERKKNQLRIEEANMRYTLASRATNEPLWDWDITNDEIFWNDKITIFGYHETVKKNWRWRADNIYIEDSERVQFELAKFINGTDEIWSCEYRFTCADGSFKFVLDRAYVLRDRHKKAYRMIGTMQDVTEKKLRQQQQEAERKRQQMEILKANLEGQEMERDYISRELHDNINQILTCANLYLSTARPSNIERSMEAVGVARTYVSTAISEIRKLAQNLSASQVDEIGLIDAIEAIREKINYLEFCKVKFVKSGNPELIPQDLSLAIFRIVQEQLTNVVKHSKATVAAISLDMEDNNLKLHISDNGIGAEMNTIKSSSGLGLSNIMNRVYAYNGELIITTSPGAGFDMSIKFSYTLEQPSATDLSKIEPI